MKQYVKSFFYRGLIFGGMGPFIMGIVYTILDASIADFSLSGAEVLVAILSTYVIAFVQAGASVFNQIEHWLLAKSLFCHFGLIYLAYLGSYLVNTWIPFEWMAVAIFTAVFVVVYFAVWLTVYLIVKASEKKLNARI